MENVIIVALIAAAVVLGICSALKHFRGQGGCCGGGVYKQKKKKLSDVRYQKVFFIGGMHCEHCKIRVEEAVNDIPGVAGRVDLKKGELKVLYAENVSDETIRARIGRAGYTVREIKNIKRG